MPTSFDPKADALTSADSVIAGTFCLMSCVVQHRLLLYAERITKNLEVLALNANLTREMRTLCHRPAERWDNIRADAARQAAALGPPLDARALH